jgi:hypothetical protein
VKSCRRGGGQAAQAAEQAASGCSDAEAARQAEARALATAELLRRENRSTWTMLDERQQTIQQLEVGHWHPPYGLAVSLLCDAGDESARLCNLQAAECTPSIGTELTPVVAQESQSQQADENVRLRSTLEEWSLANRKLELEVGRWRKAAAEAKMSAEAQEATGQQ